MPTNPARRILIYVLRKLDDEPLRFRAEAYEDLSAFLPDEASARELRRQAQALRQTDQRIRALCLSLDHGSVFTAPDNSGSRQR
jgi:hypothetical protein